MCTKTVNFLKNSTGAMATAKNEVFMDFLYENCYLFRADKSLGMKIWLEESTAGVSPIGKTLIFSV